MSPATRARELATMEGIARDAEWTEDLLVALPRPICLVGNGTTHVRWGPVIDGYATVIRMNNYRLRGFEEYVGERTHLRAVTGWYDVENRNEHVELSPFTYSCRESGNLFAYCAKNAREVLTPRTDIHPLIPEVPNPSTGLALAQLFDSLGIPVDLFGFDSFRTPHYWDRSGVISEDHSRDERRAYLRMQHVQVHTDLRGYGEVYDYCHASHAAYSHNLGLRIVDTLGIDLRNQRVLEFGAGNGALAQFLEARGCRTTAVEVSKVAFEKIRCFEKIHGNVLALVQMRGDFDTFVSFDVLEHLVENDLRILLRHAARLCDNLLVSFSTRPSGLLGPGQENLHETVQPPQWWLAQVSKHFTDLRIASGLEPTEYVIAGRSLSRPGTARPLEVGRPLRDRWARAGYRARAVPAIIEDAPDAGELELPDLHAFAAHIARRCGATHVIAIGSGLARELVRLHPELSVIGIDRLGSAERCREAHPHATWLECDLEQADSVELNPDFVRRSVVVCANVIERVRDPYPVLRLLERLLRHAPAAVLSSVERDLARGADDMGPPADPSHVREWNSAELRDLLRFVGLNVVFSGLTANNSKELQKNRSLVVLGPPASPLEEAPPPGFKVVALVQCLDQASLLRPCVEHLKAQGVDVYLVDHGSTDGTHETAAALLGNGVVGIDRLQGSGGTGPAEWASLGARAAGVARSLSAAWILHQRVDEMIESPWQGVPLRNALHRVQREGYDAVDFTTVHVAAAGDPGTADAGRAGGSALFAFEHAPEDAVSERERTYLCHVIGGGGPDRPQRERWREYPYRFLKRCHHERDRREPGMVLRAERSFHDEFLVERLSGVGVARDARRIAAQVRA